MRSKGGDYSRHHRMSFWHDNNKGKSSKLSHKTTAWERRNKDKIDLNPAKKSLEIRGYNSGNLFEHVFLDDEPLTLQTTLSALKEEAEVRLIKEVVEIFTKMSIAGLVGSFSISRPQIRSVPEFVARNNQALSILKIDSFLQNKQPKESMLLAIYKNGRNDLFFQEVPKEKKMMDDETTRYFNPSSQSFK